MAASTVDLLIAEEGEKLSAYQDSMGFWTIGVGRLIDARKGGGISQEESRYLLARAGRKISLVLAIGRSAPCGRDLDGISNRRSSA